MKNIAKMVWSIGKRLEQSKNLLYLFYPCRLSGIVVVKEEKPDAKEDVDDRGDERKVQQQAGKVLGARFSLADQVDEEDGQLEGEGEEHDQQVGKCKEFIPTFHEALIGQVVGGDVGQGKDPIGHDVGALLRPSPHLLEFRFRATASFSLRPITSGVRRTATGGELGARHRKKETRCIFLT